MRSRDDRTARASSAIRKVFDRSGERAPITMFDTRPEIEDQRWPRSNDMPLPESPGCTRDGRVRAWRA